MWKLTHARMVMSELPDDSLACSKHALTLFGISNCTFVLSTVPALHKAYSCFRAVSINMYCFPSINSDEPLFVKSKMSPWTC